MGPANQGTVFRSRDQHWPIRGPGQGVIDQSEASKCRELITHLSLVSSAPGSRVEFWQNIQTNSDMPTVNRDYFIHIGDNLTQGCDATRFTERGDTIIHYLCPLLHSSPVPLSGLLPCTSPICAISAITGSMSQVVTTLADVTTINAP